jgi:Something about silencing, SAS, complex subunit 4
VTGITEGERKSFEWKRAYFIGEVKSLLNKFRAWKEEEKRLKAEREEALARQEEDDEEGSEEDASSGDVPNSSDIDAWAARQLLQEATQAAGSGRAKGKSKARPLRRPSRPPDDTDESPRSTRTSKRRSDEPLFFGVPIPELKKREFALPPELISPGSLRAHARKRRKLNRDLQQALREKGPASPS